MKNLLYLGAMLLMFAGCSVENPEDAILDSYDAKGNSTKNNNDNGPTTIGTPILSCGEVSTDSWIIEVSAGAHGTPGGIKMEWMKAEDYEAAGNEFSSPCSQKFDSVEYQLTEDGDPVAIEMANLIGQLEDSCFPSWECDELYVFRVRAENVQGNEFSASKWSDAVFCETQPCEEICPYGKGYWRNHSNDNPGNQEDAWTETDYENGMSLGSVDYDRTQLNDILDMPNNTGNSLVNFSQHLIAAKLNFSIGVRMDGIEEAIEAADALIREKHIIDGGSFDDEEKTQSASIKEIITTFNDLCSEEE